jgi:hypothetical protein
MAWMAGTLFLKIHIKINPLQVQASRQRHDSLSYTPFFLNKPSNRTMRNPVYASKRAWPRIDRRKQGYGARNGEG